MEELLIRYALLLIFVCALVENDLAFLLAGVLVHLDIVEVSGGFVAALAGALVHDSAWFALGRSRAREIRGSQLYRRVGPLVERLGERFGAWELFFCRFIYGTRNSSLVFWGLQRLPVRVFAFIEILALSLWGSLLILLGYFVSERAAALIGVVKSTERWVFTAFLLAAAALYLARTYMRYEIKRHLPPPPVP